MMRRSPDGEVQIPLTLERERYEQWRRKYEQGIASSVAR